MGLVKGLVICSSLALGVLFLAAGLGAEVPKLKYWWFEASNIPIGLSFLVFAVAIAKFWTISTTTEETTVKREDEETKSVKRVAVRSANRE